jgi:hypothetical protein
MTLRESGADDDQIESQFTRKQILKEETEAPFRKVRIFFYAALFAAAGLGTVITLTKLLAVFSGARKEDVDMLYQNLAVNVAGLPVLGFLWKRDLDSQRSLLERIQKGGQLAGLRLKIATSEGPLVVKVSDFRRDRGIEKRVVIVAAPKDLLRTSLESAVQQSSNLFANDLIIVPLMIESDAASGDFTLTANSLESMIPDTPNVENVSVLGLPIALASWNSVIKKELAVAIKQSPSALEKGVTIIIKKNGKVGTRRFGVPIWEALVGDVEARKELGLDVSNI